MTLDSQIWHQVAAKNGCEYRGHQDTANGGKVPLFTCLITHSSFIKMPGETVGDAAGRVRRKFQEAL